MVAMRNHMMVKVQSEFWLIEAIYIAFETRIRFEWSTMSTAMRLYDQIVF